MDEQILTPEEKLVREIEDDFCRRQQERRLLERQWQLNMRFVNGEQYCDIDAKGEIYDEEKTYFWQSRQVFNHIAPVIDTRLSKLSRIRPALSVVAASDEESDRRSAELAAAILAAVEEDCDLDNEMNVAALWSEVCGTAFYKIMWNGERGAVIGVTEEGRSVREGNVAVIATPPFEIYPYSLCIDELSKQPSIIHAKAVSVDDIFSMYGVKLVGREIEEITLVPFGEKSHSGGNMPDLSNVSSGYELVIEKYEKPTETLKNGRLTVIAGGKLLYDGELPYINGENGLRDYPFVRQTSVPCAGCFFGNSVVTRLIPLQRAYNAVKNRKHEFLNRIAMGTIAVEDGSVDADEFAEDGLVPGKVIVYRQGSTPPTMLTLGAVPPEFGQEEEKILNEFSKVSGTGNLSENADSFAGITSATGLQLVIEQDEQRMNLSYGSIKRALKQIGRQVLRLYRQFATDVRLLRFTGSGNVQSLVYFKGSDISSDDVVLDADSDLNMTAAQRRTVVYEILDRGLFADSDGKLTLSAKNKILDMLGYGSFTGERDIAELNRTRADAENSKLIDGSAEVKDYDDHAVHITEHTAFLLTEELGKDAERRVLAHIEQHKKKLKDKNLSEVENG